MFLIIDNTKNLSKAYMTPLLLNVLDKLYVKYKVLSKLKDVVNIIENKKNYKIDGIIISGGPFCLSEGPPSHNNKNLKVLEYFTETPILGICFGFQLMAYYYGGKIERMNKEKTNVSTVNIKKDKSILFNNNIDHLVVFQSHKDYVTEVPKEFTITSVDKYDETIQSIESNELLRYGVQFHPEGLGHSISVLKNFVDFSCSII